MPMRGFLNRATGYTGVCRKKRRRRFSSWCWCAFTRHILPIWPIITETEVPWCADRESPGQHSIMSRRSGSWKTPAEECWYIIIKSCWTGNGIIFLTLKVSHLQEPPWCPYAHRLWAWEIRVWWLRCGMRMSLFTAAVHLRVEWLWKAADWPLPDRRWNGWKSAAQERAVLLL